MSKAKFKVGDRVECVRERTGYTAGQIYIIKDVLLDWGGTGDTHYRAEGVNPQYTPMESRFVLATASATAVSAVKFKVGDKVKCLRSNGYSVNAVVGDMYEVIALGFSPTNFRLKNVATGDVNHWGGQDFELAQYPASSVSAPADILFAPDSDCGCARNTYKDPGVEHLSICFNYVKGDKR